MSFLSKIFSNSNQVKEESIKEISPERKIELKNLINELIAEISDLEGIDKAQKLTELGEYYQEMGNADDAIEVYEKSLMENEDFGPAFDGLLQLYNDKRKKAAFAKNDQEIQRWINKTDELTALSKKIMRSK